MKSAQRKNYCTCWLLCLWLLCFSPFGSKAASNDSLYYVSYANRLTGRVYLSQKLTALNFNDRKKNYTLHYLPNTTLNLGVGATYKWLTINLAYGFSFLNQDKDRGKTRYLDLQFHGYGQKAVVDGFGQFYNGFYLSPPGTAAPGIQYYVRPDLKVTVIGLSYQRVLNYKRYSFRASFLQNEWQKRSAGSPLVGIEAYGGNFKADSTITPRVIDNSSQTVSQNHTNFFQFGPTAGYAYTYVLNEFLFVTAVASAGFELWILHVEK